MWESPLSKAAARSRAALGSGTETRDLIGVGEVLEGFV